jgi:hypothetical protein
VELPSPGPGPGRGRCRPGPVSCAGSPSEQRYPLDERVNDRSDLVSDVGPGDAVVDWVQDSAVGGEPAGTTPVTWPQSPDNRGAIQSAADGCWLNTEDVVDTLSFCVRTARSGTRH